MKKIRIGMTIFMLVLIGAAWASVATARVESNSIYQDAVDEAQLLIEEKLYQKAIVSLERALNEREAVDTRCMWRDTYGLAYEDGVATKQQYVSAMESVAGLQPENVDNWETLIGFCLETNDYKSAYSYCKKAEDIGVSSEKLADYQRQVLYSYTVNGRVYSGMYYSPSGYNVVSDGDKWGILAQDGDWVEECTYDFIGPVSNSLVKVIGDLQELRIVDNQGIVQAILDGGVEAARVIGDGLLPLLQDGVWKYFDSEHTGFVTGDYDEATAFSNGIAAVKTGGIWKLIDREGNRVGDAEFEDVKLYDSGEYFYDGVFVAKADGKYGLYNQNGELVAGISNIDMDVAMGGGIAYQDPNGKWGYMNKKGEVLIEPQYMGAKSFSNGLAAVCIDGNWGFINEANEVVIECKFLDADYFTSEGVCFVSEVEGEYYMITLRFQER